MKGIIGLTRKLPSEREVHHILMSEFGGDKIQRQNSISERDPDWQQEWKISKCTSVRPKMHIVKMRSKKNLHGREHTNFTKSSSRKDTARMSTKQTSSCVRTKAKKTATGLPIHCKERMYIVDSGAALHMMDDLL